MFPAQFGECTLIDIEVRSLSICYEHRRTGERISAVKDLSFSIQAGKFVCVVGTSGCGKTTLLNVIAGLQKPTSGQVLLGGVPVEGPGKERAMVFQTAALLPWRTVLHNVTYGLEIQGCAAEEARRSAREMIALVGLSGFEDSYPHELSGGMQQRANLARALVTRPDLLLMDEPFASLDAQMREFMQTEIERIWRQTGQTSLFVTHMIDEAIFLADEVIILTTRPGRVKAIVPVDLPRPRAHCIKKSPAFHAIEDEMRDLIQAEFDPSLASQSQLATA
jgi:NitT/TauT family transport system ATP-binding protein